MLRQDCFKLAILALFLFASSLFSIQKIPSSNAREIVYYSLFNYDNLIADYYESDKTYQKNLAAYLTLYTKLSSKQALALLNLKSLNESARPIAYMKSLNKHLMSSYNYTFLYDY